MDSGFCDFAQNDGVRGSAGIGSAGFETGSRAGATITPTTVTLRSAATRRVQKQQLENYGVWILRLRAE